MTYVGLWEFLACALSGLCQNSRDAVSGGCLCNDILVSVMVLTSLFFRPRLDCIDQGIALY
jgi:hypothetical protein